MSVRSGGAIGVALTLVGLGCVLAALFVLQRTIMYLSSGLQAEGTVVRVDAQSSRCGSGSSRRACTTYVPVIRFSDTHGVLHEVKGNTSSSSPNLYQVGEKLEVRYLPDAPHQAIDTSFFSLWGGSSILGVLGIVFGTIGFLTLKQVRMRKELLTAGRKILAEVIGIEEVTKRKTRHRTRVRVHRTSVSFVVVAQWRDPSSGQTHVFRSDSLSYRPDHLEGREVEVYIDPSNPSRYVFGSVDSAAM